MSRRLLPCGLTAALVFVATGTCAQTAASAKTAARDCAGLLSWKQPDVRITSADAVAADPTANTVPHCKVLGVIGTEIRFQVLLPDSWNGAFLMSGNFAFAGTLESDGLDHVGKGYAHAVTDTGHQASPIQASWALHNPERIANWAHRGVHQTAETARAVVRAYYGRPPAFAYFIGCSTGGWQALMEAQRYPQDFDGLIAGAPSYNITNIAGGFIKNIKAVFPTRHSARTPLVTPENLVLIERAALEACDASNGVRDGVIDSPPPCRFSLAQVKACANDVAAADCLTRAQRGAIEAVYAPAVDGGGKEIYPGQPVGAEGEGWRGAITGVDDGLLAETNGEASSGQLVLGPQFFKYFMIGDPAWDYTTYDLARWAHDTAAMAPILNADNPDLSGFKKRRGKLIVWHGWADPALNAISTVNYYRRVLKHDAAANDYTRLYLLPGVMHCGGGPGPDRIDWLQPMTDWVEHGKAPQRVISAKLGPDGKPVRTRPLCPFPQHAVYKGTGSTDEEGNFECK